MPEVGSFRNPVESPTFYSWLFLNQTNQAMLRRKWTSLFKKQRHIRSLTLPRKSTFRVPFLMRSANPSPLGDGMH
jgi:hypothetical protein